MVERLDAPQPTFPLPPLADIPDEDVDKADDAKRIVNGHTLIPRIVHGLTPSASDDPLRACRCRRARCCIRRSLVLGLLQRR